VFNHITRSVLENHNKTQDMLGRKTILRPYNYKVTHQFEGMIAHIALAGFVNVTGFLRPVGFRISFGC